MTSELLIDRDKLAIVQLTNAGHWVRLELWLANEYTGGDLVRFGRQGTVSIEGVDTLSSSYNRANWLSGVADGAFYAFRTLSIPRQRTVVMELAGRLKASDMEAVACAAAIGVAALANKDLPNSLAPGWTSEAHITERHATDLDVSDDSAKRAH